MECCAPSISLCMIVRNEEKYLDGCLASAKPYVDEMVVVDTGSTDATVDIARSYGARVFHFTWIDDFAAARNESLKHAGGDWVLQLDADERLNLLGFPDSLRELARVPNIDAYVVLIRSYRREHGRTVYGINQNLRFFRRLPGIRYERRVHESVEPFLAKRGSLTANAGFIIDHLGYEVEGSELSQKLQRNLEILEGYVSAEPDNAFALYYLGGTYRALGRKDEALAVLQRALSVPGSTKCLQAMILNAMNLIHMADGDYDRVIETARESLRVLPHQNTARYFLGAAHYNRGGFREALPYLYFCYQYWRRPPVRQMTELSQEYTMSEPDLLKALALCYGHQKDYPKTIVLARRFLESYEENGQIHQTLGLALLNSGQYSDGIHHLERASELGVDPSCIQLPLAYAHFRLRRFPEAVEHFGRVMEVGDQSLEESHRLLRLMVREDELRDKLQHLFEVKRSLCERASFAQLGDLVSCLCRFERLEALKTLFLSIRHRTAELEALLVGVVEYFEAEGRLSAVLPVAETLAAELRSHPAFLRILGIICIKLGNYCRAVEVFKCLGRLEPGNEVVRRTVAALRATVGQEAQALQSLRDTSERNPAGLH